METFYSDITRQKFPVSERVSGKSLRRSILELIQKEKPEFTVDSYLSVSELSMYRRKYIEQFLNSQVCDQTDLEKTVLNSLQDNTTLTDKIDL
jgi:hypothetical protein